MSYEISDLKIFIRWINHGHPRGGDVVAIADAGTLRPEVIFTVRYGRLPFSKQFTETVVMFYR